MKLRAGETLVYKTRPHWIVLGWATACFTGSTGSFPTNNVSNADHALMWLGLGWTFVVFAAIAAVLAQFYRWSSRFILTA